MGVEVGEGKEEHDHRGSSPRVAIREALYLRCLVDHDRVIIAADVQHRAMTKGGGAGAAVAAAAASGQLPPLAAAAAAGKGGGSVGEKGEESFCGLGQV